MSEQSERDNGLTYPVGAVRSAYDHGKREGRKERDREWVKTIVTMQEELRGSLGRLATLSDLENRMLGNGGEDE